MTHWPKLVVMIFFGVTADGADGGDDQHGEGGELQDGKLFDAGGREDELVQPSVRGLGFQYVVENDLERPRFRKVRYAFDDYSDDAEGEATGVGAQQPVMLSLWRAEAAVSCVVRDESPGGTISSPRKGIALGDIAARQTALEPLRALGRRSMGEGLGADISAGHSLHTIVAYGAGGAYASLDIPLLDQISLRCGIRPDAGEAIRLQFQADRQRIRLRRASLLEGLDLVGDAQDLLDMMADLMGQHVGLGEFAGRPEPVFQFVVEAEVHVDFLVRRTIEGSGGRLSEAAR